MIHRAILGSFERFIGILTEHYAGEFPFFLAPTQVIIIPIAEPHQEYSNQLAKELEAIEIDVEVFSQNESLNKRIRTAEKKRVPIILVIGDNEVENKIVAVRDRRERKQFKLTKEEFLTMVIKKKDEVQF